jgi:hypothetical protein
MKIIVMNIMVVQNKNKGLKTKGLKINMSILVYNLIN